MSFWRKLFGKAPKTRDEFADWPEPVSSLPTFDHKTGHLGELELGSNMDAARVLGRPALRENLGENAEQLFYPRLGLILQYAEGRLAYGSFLIAHDPYQPEHEQLAYARVATGLGLTLDSGVKRDALLAELGPPTESETDEEETIDEYDTKGLVHMIEYHLDGTLKRWSWMVPFAKNW